MIVDKKNPAPRRLAWLFVGFHAERDDADSPGLRRGSSGVTGDGVNGIMARFLGRTVWRGNLFARSTRSAKWAAGRRQFTGGQR